MFFLFIVSICFSLSANSQVNETLGRVGKDLVTLRDVETHYMVVHMLYHFKAEPKELPLNANSIQRELSNYMLEKMIFNEASSFNLAPVKKREIQRKGSLVLGRILKSGLAKRWKAWQVETSELDRLLESNLRSRKLISIKRKAAEVLVSESEVDSYMEENKVKVSERSNPKYRNTVKNFLGRRQGEQRLREWFQMLKQKYEIRTF